jgi:hypothetical protein
MPLGRCGVPRTGFGRIVDPRRRLSDKAVEEKIAVGIQSGRRLPAGLGEEVLELGSSLIDRRRSVEIGATSNFLDQ